MALTPRSVFRYFKVDGVPSSGKHDPVKSEIIQMLEQLFGVSHGGWVVTQTRAALNGVTPEEQTDGGVVLNDPNPANNGYYSREAGAWVGPRPFPDTFARVALSGSGTAQSGAVNTGVNPASIEVFFAKVATPNTGPLTLTIGGGPDRQVVNLAGNPLSAGEWTGMVMFYLNDANQYQLLIDAGAAQAAAEYVALASLQADRAEQALEDVLMGSVPDDGVTAVKISTSGAGDIAKKLGDDMFISDIASLNIPPGIKVIRPVGFSVVDPLSTRWKRVSTPGVPKAWHKQSADGQWWGLNDHIAHPYQFGNVANGQDDTDAFQQCIEWMKSAGPAPTGEMIVPNRPGYDIFLSDVEIKDWSGGQYRRKISGFGSVIRPYLGGSTNGTLFKISNSPRVTMEGFQLLNTTANTLRNCIYIENGSSYFTLRDMTILGGGNTEPENLINIEQGGGGGDFGNFWGLIENVEAKGTGPNNIASVIRSYGQNNAMTIRKCHLSGSDRTASVCIWVDGASMEMLNALLIEDNDMGGSVYTIYVRVSDGDAIQGFKSLNNRFEHITHAHVFEMKSGAATANQHIPIIENNMYTDMLGSAVLADPGSSPIDFRDRKNASGTATIPNGASFIGVVFPWQEFNGQYTVSLKGGNDPSLRIDSAGDGGFTILRDGTAGDAVITWTLNPAYRA